MKVRWITPALGTAPFAAECPLNDTAIIDVRDLVDKAGNDADAIRSKIRRGADELKKGKKVIVCCDCGISRSNAIAAGIHAFTNNIDFDDALRTVIEQTGESLIKTEMIKTVREALGFQKIKYSGKGSVLITGGNGFIGRALMTKLGTDFKTLSPARDRIDLVKGSTGLDLLTAKEDVGCIVHLANPGIYATNAAMGQSLTMLRNVIDTCLAGDITLVYLSCAVIYSGHTGTVKADEATPALPRGPHGETKYLAEIMIRHFTDTAGLKCALLRSSPVYGPACGREVLRPKFLFNFIEKALRSDDIVTHYYKNGEPALDLLNVDDLARAFLFVLKSGFTGVLNLGTGILTSTHDIARMIARKLNSRSIIKNGTIDACTASIAMDWSKAQSEIGWAPEVVLENGIQEILTGAKIIA